jgi:hypothetical protein
MAIGQNQQQDRQNSSTPPRTGPNQAGRNSDKEIGDKEDQKASQSPVKPDAGTDETTRQAAGQGSQSQQKPGMGDKKTSTDEESAGNEKKSDDQTSSTRSNQSDKSSKDSRAV